MKEKKTQENSNKEGFNDENGQWRDTLVDRVEFDACEEKREVWVHSRRVLIVWILRTTTSHTWTKDYHSKSLLHQNSPSSIFQHKWLIDPINPKSNSPSHQNW